MEPVDNPAHAHDRSSGWHRRTDVWRGRRSDAILPAVATGYPELDRWLPAHGWPLGSLCEILHEADGGGELSLLLPALIRLASAQRPVVWIVPPHQPHAPALRQQQIALEGLRVVRCDSGQALWAAEQCLRAGCCAAVLVWPEQATVHALRRLQLAVETGRCHGFLFRDIRHLTQPSPAPLRLSVRREDDRIQVRFDKCRGMLTPPPGFIDVTPARADDMPLPKNRPAQISISATGDGGLARSTALPTGRPLSPVTRISEVETAANADPASIVSAIAADLFDTATSRRVTRPGVHAVPVANPDLDTVSERRETWKADDSGISSS